MVFAYFTLTFPTTSNGANVTIGGLPLTVPNQDYARIDSPVGANTVTAGYTFRAVKNTATFQIINTTSGPSINSAWSTATIQGCIVYPIS
ncbi:hypothetical protein [Reyranella soli]|uniref:Uncharacterized protein n=1 Tax=Reyranella soli TaxID=1230389 RepID=A0A512NRJ7_9HYPH|nr:hypothetical protein [Reyranella soli]GEP61565.1 hypothetical protein RSO01_87310 [Reyranella soli]